MNTCDKYYWVINHPKLTPESRQADVELTPHMVCPTDNTIKSDTSLNTKLQWWVEVCFYGYVDEYHDDLQPFHDWELDTGGDSSEEAIENLYDLVLAEYGDYSE